MDSFYLLLRLAHGPGFRNSPLFCWSSLCYVLTVRVGNALNSGALKTETINLSKFYFVVEAGFVFREPTKGGQKRHEWSKIVLLGS
jgi:hypothetical protein